MKLKKLEIKAGGGIHPTAPVIIDFSRSNFVSLKGDNGSGKTSTIEGLLYALGELGGKKFTDRYKNIDEDKIDIDFTFTGNDRRNYHVRAVKSGIKVTYEGESKDLPEPVALLRRLIGQTGINPLPVKNEPIKEMVKFLASFANKNPEEIEKKERKIKDGIEGAKTTRAQANKSAKAIIELFTDEGVMVNGEIVEKVWTANEAKYSKAVDVKALSAKLDEAAAASDKYMKAEEKLKYQRNRRAQIEDQIKALQEELATVDKSINGGEKFLSENKGAKQEYDRVKEQYDNAAAQSVKYSQWQDIKKKKKELDEYQDVAQRADAREKELIQERMELQAELLPDIKGVELVMEDTHEDGKIKKAGFYRDGVSSVQMSTGEWVKTIIEMYKKNRVKVLVVDNAEMLGSEGYDLLKNLSEKNGCYILVGEVSRGQKELDIDYA